jgi:hypothetical protein
LHPAWELPEQEYEPGKVMMQMTRGQDFIYPYSINVWPRDDEDPSERKGGNIKKSLIKNDPKLSS